MTHQLQPKWTVLYNIVSPESSEWVGTGYEFFDEESHALSCYNRHKSLGNVPTKRPYSEADRKYLGAVHDWESQLPKSPNPVPMPKVEPPREFATEEENKKLKAKVMELQGYIDDLHAEQDKKNDEADDVCPVCGITGYEYERERFPAVDGIMYVKYRCQHFHEWSIEVV